MPLILNGTTGVSGVDGTAATPAAQGSDTNTGVFYGTDTVSISTGGTARVVVNSSGQTVLGAGTASLPAVTTTGDTNTGIYFPAADTIAFAEGGAESARFDSSGNLLVGTTSATSSSRLSVKSSGSTGVSYNSYFSNSAGTVLLFIRDDGGFTFGTTSSGGPYSYTSGSAANVFIDASGYLGRSTSSLKYKRDVMEATHGLSEVLKLRSVTFKNKQQTDNRVFGGLIAEEVDAAGLTEFVAYDTDGKPDSLHYGNMAGLFVKAIQELSAKLDAAEARIAALEAK